MEEHEDRLEVLRKLEEGSIDVDEAVELLGSDTGNAEPAGPPSGPSSGWWRLWWLLPFIVGVGMLAVGARLAWIGGWWWLCAAPAILVGTAVAAIALSSIRSMWLHVRVKTRKTSWPRQIAISLPVPVDLTAWFLRRYGRRIPNLDQTAIDELLLSVSESTSADSPLYVEVDNGEGGERVQVYLG